MRLSTKNSWFKIVLFALLLAISYVSFTLPADAARIGISKPGNNLGLVGWWTFDGADMIPNVRDRSGQGNNGNLTNFTATTTVPGKIGQALDFASTTYRVGLGDVAFLDGLTSATFSVWVKPDSPINQSGTEYVYRKFSDSTNLSYAMYRTSSGIMCFYVKTTSTVTECSASNVVLSGWHHVVGVYNGSDLSIYVDGVESGAPASAQTGGIFDSGSQFAISNNGFTSGGAGGWIGTIDDFRVYNRAFSVNEVRAQYSSGLVRSSATPNSNSPTLEQGLIGHWTFDGKDIVSSIRDVSTNGKHANLSGQISTTTVSGKLGQALSFDGVDDFVNTTLDFLGIPTFTVSQWVYAKNPGAFQSMWSADTSAGGCSGDGVYFSGPTTLRFRAASAGNDDVAVPNIKNKWTHVVSTYDATNRRVYFDNVLVYNQAGGSATTGDVDFQIGGYNSCSSPVNFEGYIDDTRIYNRVLSTNEISALYNSGGSKIASTPNAGKSALNSGLVGHWTFDGKNMIPNIVDSSGQGNHGNLSGQTSTTTTSGKIGQGLDFDGINDQVSVTDTNNSLDTATVVTASAWVYPRDLKSGAGWSAIVGKGDNYYLGYLDNSFSMTFNDGSWQNHFTGTYPSNQWYHVVGVIDNVNDRVKIYINGVLVTDEAETANMVVNNSATTIGQDASQFVEGIIDDVRVYTRVLSDTEVRQLYNLGR